MLTKDQQRMVAQELAARFSDIDEATMRKIGDLLFNVTALEFPRDAEYLLDVAGDESGEDTVRNAARYCLSVISGVEE